MIKIFSFFEMCITTVNPIRNMTYDCYSKHPKHMCEIVLYGMNDETPRLTNALVRTSSHTLIRK